MSGPAYAEACRHTVTVYRLVRENGQGRVERKVYHRSAFLEMGRHWAQAAGGPRGNGDFLLVLCAATGALQRGDKVMAGEGPVVLPGEWERFVPVENPGLVVVGRVDEKRGLDGAVCHLEASGV